MGHYQPRFGLIQWKRGTDLKMRSPNDLHLRQVEIMKKHIAENVAPYQECDKLTRAYDEERINQNKLNSQEFLRARTALQPEPTPLGESRPLTDLEQGPESPEEQQLKRLISKIDSKRLEAQ